MAKVLGDLRAAAGQVMPHKILGSRASTAATLARSAKGAVATAALSSKGNFPTTEVTVMAVGTLVDSDYLTSVITDLLIGNLNGRTLSCRAYNTPLNPGPATPYTSFTAVECIFDTYAPIPLSSPWQLGQQIQPGEWATINGPFGWASPLTTPDTIAGLFVTDSFSQVYFSYEFVTPIPFTIGSSPFEVNLQHNQWSRVLLPGPF